MNRQREFASLLLLIAAGLRMAAQGNQPLEQAWTAAANGDRVKAIAIARDLVKREPANAEVRLLLGSLLTEQGERPEAIEQLSLAVHLRPASADAWNALGEAYNTFGEAKAAREPFERAVKLSPNFAVAEANLGAVLLQAGEMDPAVRHLDRAIRLLGNSPDAASAHYLRAKICVAMGQPDEAVRHLEQAIKLRADFAEAWSDLGEAYRLRLDAERALQAFERAVQLKPDDPVAQYRLGAEYLRRDRIPQALEHLQAAYRLVPSDQATLNALQTALRQGGRLAEADQIKQELASVLRMRARKSQDDLKALKLNNEGANLEHAGNLREALSRYQEALQLSPDHNGIRVNYATALLRLGRWTEGLTQLHEAAERDAGNPQIKIALKDAISQAPRALLPAWAKPQRAP